METFAVVYNLSLIILGTWGWNAVTLIDKVAGAGTLGVDFMQTHVPQVSVKD